MFLSFIIPFFNVEPFFNECLDSLFAQDLSDCEVIAVNDGSIDGSKAIIEEYKNKYPDIITILDKVNGGQSSARNMGVECARGDYLYFIDSDDFLKPHAVATIKQSVGGSEKADVVYLDCIVTHLGKRWDTFSDRNVPLMDLRSFVSYAYEHKIGLAANPCSYVYRTSYWKSCGLKYEEGLKYEDALFKYQLFIREDGIIKLIHVDEPFYVYRVAREGSTTTKLTLKNFIDKQQIRKKADQLWKNQGIVEVAYYHMLLDSIVYTFFEAYGCGLIKEYRKFWDKDDVKIMRKGVSNDWEYGLWLLTKLNPKWMTRYYINELPTWIRRVTNIVLSGAKHRYKRRQS